MAGSGDIRAGRAFIELVVRDKLAAGLAAAAAKLRAYSRTFAVAGGALLGGAAALATPLVAAATNFGATGAALDDMSQRTGMSVEALSELTYAAEQSGTSLEAIEKSSKKLAKGVTEAADGSKSARESFAALGLSWAAMAAMSPDDQLEAVADGLAGITDPSRRAALAQDVLGKSGADMIPLLSGGAAGLRELRDEAKRLGLTVSAETTTKAAVLDDALAGLSAVAKDAWFELGSGLAPVVTTLAKTLQAVLVPAAAFIERHQDVLALALPVAAGIAGVGIALLGIAGGLRLGASLLSGLGTASRGLGSISGFLTRPFTAGLAGVRSFGAGIGTAIAAGVSRGTAALGAIPAALGRGVASGAALGGRLGSAIAGGLVRVTASAGRAALSLRSIASPAAWISLGSRIRSAAVSVAGLQVSWTSIRSAAATAATRTAAAWTAAAGRIRSVIGGAVSASIGRLGALGAAGVRGAGRGIGRGIGAGLGGMMGAASMIGGFLPGVMGSALSMGGMLMPMLAGLLNPATLLIAAIAGGVYAWTRFSASGQTALAGLQRFFGPLLETAKKTIGGIVDAFRAGNLKLVGQIAIAGLKSVLLQGLAQLVTLFPAALGPLGDWLAKMGSQLASGRWAELGQTAMAGLRAAWQAGVAGLRMLWGSFTRGVVSAMASAARIVADLWGKAVSGIANGMLEMASSSAAMGKLMSGVLGVDMFAEREKSNKIDAATRANMARELPQMIAAAQRAKAGTATAEERQSLGVEGLSAADAQAKLDNGIANWTRELAALGEPMPDFLAGARSSVDQSLAEANQKIDAALNDWTATADAQATETQAAAQQQLTDAMANLAPAGAGGVADLGNTLAEARRQLQAGLTEAASQAAAAKAKANQEQGDEDLAPGGSTAAKIAGTFSGWAIGQQFGGGQAEVQQKQLAALVEANRIKNEERAERRELNALMRRFGVAAGYTP